MPPLGHPGRVDFTIRSAVAADQPAIVRLVRAAHLNNRGLDWPNFQVADRDGQVIGVAQVRPHPDGGRELASLVVSPADRGAGVGSALIAALLSATPGPLYAIVERVHAGWYTRWGFREIQPDELPASIRRALRIGRIITAVLSVPARRRIRLVPIARPAGAATGDVSA